MNNEDKSVYHVTLIHKFRKLYAVISPEQCIVMRTFKKDEANLIAFLLNNKTDITFMLNELIQEERCKFSDRAIRNTDECERVRKFFWHLRTKDKPW